MPRLRQPPSARLMAWTAFWVFLIDQATKWFVIHWLDMGCDNEVCDEAMDVWPPFFNLRMVENRGVNFGLLAEFDMRWPLVALAMGISAFVVWIVQRERGGRLVQLSAGLLVGGALGNVVDRLIYGAVQDFLNFPFFGEAIAWVLERVNLLWAAVTGAEAQYVVDRLAPQYSLNVADISIVVGAVGLVIFSGRGNGAAKPRRAAKTG